ncbi:MAG: 4-hydroxy-tetrahydrodipicolinate reductase [Actinomycetota bacterium]|jgi:4-hydroxy-tetrahydrodipicolinate reductase|nr:4-hydroxy-tetrahydrodipicolinate reductase [Actinomycetota bacterium]
MSVRPTRVAVIGAGGRMGVAACAAVDAAEDLDLVARLGSSDPRETMVEAGATVAVDLTRPDAVMDNVRFCVEHGIHVVVGTSGFDGRRSATIREWLEDHAQVGVVVVPNFAIGAVLMMHLAGLAARHFESAEVVELHHAGKADAPSGTARRTAQIIAAARADAGLKDVPDATTSALDGARGADVDGIHVHSVRLPGLVAHQEVIFGASGETLTLRHDSTDRASFMPGLLLALREVADRPGLTVGLDDLLGLA